MCIDVISGQPTTRLHNLHLAMILYTMKIIIHFEKSKKTVDFDRGLILRPSALETECLTPTLGRFRKPKYGQIIRDKSLFVAP